MSRYYYALAATGGKTDRSSKQMPAKAVISKANWHLAQEDTKYLYLQVDESKATGPLEIGEYTVFLRAFESSEDDEKGETDAEETALLTQLASTERSNNQRLNLIYEKLGEQFIGGEISLKQE